MNYPYISTFPNAIDKRTFFSDVDLETISHMNIFLDLIKQGKYTEANSYLSQSPVHSYTAGLFNFIEAKTHALQDYILQQEKYNPYCVADDEPNVEVGEFWI